MGTAYISFEKEAHAVKAKSAFDGAPAKGTLSFLMMSAHILTRTDHAIFFPFFLKRAGQNITVRFDHRPIKIGTGAPGTLLARMEPTISCVSLFDHSFITTS